MNYKYILIIILIVLILGGGVLAYKFWSVDSANKEKTNLIVGGDKDAHGCIGSAGYSWCEAKKTCIRPWEEYCTATTPKTAVFICAGSKTITATFYPTDDKYVDLNLSDGKKLSVPRAISASGARYANSNESFVFWNKGDTAFITEDGVTTFTDCITNIN